MTDKKYYNARVQGTLQYVWLNKTSPFSGMYQVTLGNIDPKDAESLRDAECVITKNDNYGYSATFKCKDIDKLKPKIVDAQLNPINIDKVSIGTGTTAILEVSLGYGKFAKPAHYLNGIQVLKLVEYTGKQSGSVGFEKQEGYTAPKSTEIDASKWQSTVNE